MSKASFRKEIHRGKPHKHEDGTRLKSFMREINALDFFSGSISQNIKTPRLIETDYKSYFNMENIRGLQSWPSDESSKLSQVLVEFAMSGDNIVNRSKASKKLFPSMSYYLAARFLRSFFKKKYLYFLEIKIFFHLVKCYFKQPRLGRHFLIHNDLHCNNIVTDIDNNVYAIDFESCGLDQRWVFVDVINLSKQETPFDIKWSQLSAYCYELSRQSFFKDLNLYVQIKFALITYFYKKLLKKRGTSRYNNAYQVLHDLLLNDKALLSFLKEKASKFGDTNCPLKKHLDQF